MIAKAHLFEFKTDKLNWGIGVRVVVALFVPLIVLGALGLTQYWASVSFGVIYVGISDILTLKAPIGYRMRRLGIITLAGALLTALGLVLGVNWELAVLGTFVITLLCGATLAWGKPAALAAYLPQHLVRRVTFLSRRDGEGLAAGACMADWWSVIHAVWRWCASSGNPPLPNLHKEQLRRSRRNPSSRRTSHCSGSRTHQFRFVLLKALAVTVGAAIGFGFGLPYGYWIPIITLVVLQADYEETRNKFMSA